MNEPQNMKEVWQSMSDGQKGAAILCGSGMAMISLGLGLLFEWGYSCIFLGVCFVILGYFNVPAEGGIIAPTHSYGIPLEGEETITREDAERRYRERYFSEHPPGVHKRWVDPTDADGRV